VEGEEGDVIPMFGSLMVVHQEDTVRPWRSEKGFALERDLLLLRSTPTVKSSRKKPIGPSLTVASSSKPNAPSLNTNFNAEMEIPSRDLSRAL
jgi:hypothetical protein